MKIVFHLDLADSGRRSKVLRNAGNLLDDSSTEVEHMAIVAHSGGIQTLLEDSDMRTSVEQLMERGINFFACSNTMEKKDIEEGDLIEGVEPVPSGVGKVASLESDGYVYLKP